MKEIVYTIKDPLGIHARPAGLFVKKLQEFECGAAIFRGSESCDGKKLLALMKMRVKPGDEIKLKFDGSDEDAAAKAAKEFLSANL